MLERIHFSGAVPPGYYWLTDDPAQRGLNRSFYGRC